MSSFTKTPNFDSLLLQTLMGRFPGGPQTNTPALDQTLEDLLSDNLNLNDTKEDEIYDRKTYLAKEEFKLEREIIKTIARGNIEALKPNSGQTVTVNNHHICVGFHEEDDSGYRAWEWHGHIMLLDDENGCSLEYIYGNYFERVRDDEWFAFQSDGEKNDEEMPVVEEKPGNLGLRELIGSGDGSGSGGILHCALAGTGRILHYILNAGSPRPG